MVEKHITQQFQAFHVHFIRTNWDKYVESEEEPLWMMLLGDGITHLDFDTQHTQALYMVYFDVYAKLP